ncbi:hypothetical protein [Pantoea sp. At-9b]|jgi:hypothetical protein|uniref:hypothetical protein n=1 Tax=Pantoea sp. (strain At-9b) TaxID=592316 RepID=UPI0001B3F1D3|nr:hypothetical protein [Pantoea sp. At-9b]ADU69425.1 hypothetical protein Pat9b_2113 [Pantoea sp. At-9b]
MQRYIEDITAFEHEDDSGIIATVKFIYDDHNRTIKVLVRIPYDKLASLAEIERRLFEKAKQQLQELVSEI